MKSLFDAAEGCALEHQNGLRAKCGNHLDNGRFGCIHQAPASSCPTLTKGREAARRSQSMNSLRQLSLACMMVEEKTHRLPTGNITVKDGKPLFSWRVAILPYLDYEEAELYKQFHLDEPWDSEHNKALIAKMPVYFRDPHAAKKPPTLPTSCRWEKE